MATLDRAIQIAAAAHAGQTDKELLPYILHPLRVMMLVSSNDERVAAVLHDVVEDTAVTHDDLEREGFSTEVLDAVHRLTRTPDAKYVDYVVRCKASALARAVKLADLTDNSRLDRNILRTERFDQDLRRVGKYLVSYKYLTDQIDEDTYRRLMVDLE
jgi:(p)ppGpp synthase/HD superfamily hydrolase